MKRGIMLMLLVGAMAGTSRASIVVHGNKLSFDDAATTSTIVFDATPDSVKYYDHVYGTGAGLRLEAGGLGLVEFQTDPFSSWPNELLVANAGVLAVPGTLSATHNYASFGGGFVPDYDSVLRAVLPADIYAVGAVFGEFLNSGGTLTSATITLKDGGGGVLHSAVYTVAELGLGPGEVGTFLGFVSDSDAIALIEFSPDEAVYLYPMMADFQYGIAAAIVPEPASCVVWSLIGLSCIGAGWWRRRKAA